MTTSFWQLLSDNRIVIPLLQRDYAQGRTTGKIPAIRENLLNAIFSSFEPNHAPLELDFIYGYTESLKENDKVLRRTFYPLDGQQRLTTLFLLHWYIAAKEGHLEKAASQLIKFSYETRPGAREFCENLAGFQPDDFIGSIKSSIINQRWFYATWRHDPTIMSMLTMLDAIQKKTLKHSLDQVWPSMISDAAPIVFHVLPMEELGLPDDLYIKMNSRGKALTEFEHFKARFSEVLSPAQVIRFNEQIDLAWSDLFWDIYKTKDIKDIAQKVDAAMMRFIYYVTDLLVAKNKIAPVNPQDEFAVFRTVYSQSNNTDFLFSILDAFVHLYKVNKDFFSKAFYLNDNEYILGKTKLFFESRSMDLFQNCADLYDPQKTTNPFPIGSQLLLYACIIHIVNGTLEFPVRIRQLRNLITNSGDTLRAENYSSLLNSVEDLVGNGKLDGHQFLNSTQLTEEIDKLQFIHQNPHLREVVELLEDHKLLQGCLAIIRLTPDLESDAEQFHRLFSTTCDYEKISCALLTIGDYSQKIGNRRRFGNSNLFVWRDLFMPSKRKGDFEKTQETLQKLLDLLKTDSSLTVSNIIQTMLEQYEMNPTLERSWSYYYINYADFRKHEKGFYHWPDPEKQYESYMIKSIERDGKNWDPILFTIKNIAGHKVSLGNYSSPLIYSHGLATLRIFNRSEGYQLEAVDQDGQILLNHAVSDGYITSEFIYPIQQSPLNHDTEDRVQKGIELIEKLDSLKSVVSILSDNPMLPRSGGGEIVDAEA